MTVCSHHHSLQVCILEPLPNYSFLFLPLLVAVDAIRNDQLDDEVEQLVSSASASTRASVGTGASFVTLDHYNEVIVVANGGPPPEPATHPVTTDTMEKFDGEAFNVSTERHQC
jgi:hypothetical protein